MITLISVEFSVIKERFVKLATYSNSKLIKIKSRETQMKLMKNA